MAASISYAPLRGLYGLGRVRGVARVVASSNPREPLRTISRGFQHSAPQRSTSQAVPDFAFAFDIDGVLVRSSDPIPRAREALLFLQRSRIPFILLTNGGGKHETERITELSSKLRVPLSARQLIQSHTPFAALAPQYHDRHVLVVGGDHGSCRSVAHAYGFQHVVTPADILGTTPHIWPSSAVFSAYYSSFAQPLRNDLQKHKRSLLQIGAIFVFADPRDWALDLHLILDLLLSHQGHLGTRSPRNGDASLPNRGYQQDGQPPLYFSNPDLWWAARYHLPRLGQGGFREALEGVWRAVTGGEKEGVELKKEVLGKPGQAMFEYAERALGEEREEVLKGEGDVPKLRKVYVIGDNPESDIRGGNMFESPVGTEWESVLVRTGVFDGGKEPAWKPKTIVKDVWEAVQWGLDRSGWKERLE
ncbi:HAD-superfamily hydrolase [Viridothelium virens]|uniref:HAD-superfamily hydrolase n=1 Tax=Viridothelium virens TaxID=1048519 RepID=A0A6A6HB44_VIRVR|nr:HAD-superfamily hydrolase [Viridothelium virens]